MIITVKSQSRTQFIDITSHVNDKIRKAGIETGLCMLFIPHTTAAITINESADPNVKKDIEMALDKLAPWDDGYRHMEGNSAAHIKSTLVGASELVAVENSQIVLGTWQGIFFCEFDGPRTRKVHLKIL
jgi:secondary thiamine-phosphate synthase enzyme